MTLQDNSSVVFFGQQRTRPFSALSLKTLRLQALESVSDKLTPEEIADLIRQLLAHGFTLQEIAEMFPPKEPDPKPSIIREVALSITPIDVQATRRRFMLAARERKAA